MTEKLTPMQREAAAGAVVSSVLVAIEYARRAKSPGVLSTLAIALRSAKSAERHAKLRTDRAIGVRPAAEAADHA